MLFMNTPYWRAVEREMQTVPNFKPRGLGFRVNGITLNRYDDYKNAAAKLLYSWRRPNVTKRIAAIYRKSGTLFYNSEHEEFFGNFIKNNPLGGCKIYAAVFILSAEYNDRFNRLSKLYSRLRRIYRAGNIGTNRGFKSEHSRDPRNFTRGKHYSQTEKPVFLE